MTMPFEIFEPDNVPYVYFGFGFTAISLGWYLLRPIGRQATHAEMRVNRPSFRTYGAIALVVLHLAFAWHVSMLSSKQVLGALVLVWFSIIISISILTDAIADLVAERGGVGARYWSRSRVCAAIVRHVAFVLMTVGFVIWLIVVNYTLDPLRH